MAQFKPVEGVHYSRLESGILVVNRHFENLDQPYTTEPIPDYLSRVNHHKSAEDRYKKLLQQKQLELARLVRQLKEKRRFLLFVGMGRDAAGKTGVSKRIRDAVDDRKLFDTIHIGVPEPHELRHYYQWRFSTGDRMPEYGQVRYFDRSWYERLLVETVMDLTPRAEIEKSFAEIRMMERLLQSQGGIIIKFWIDITKDEQLRRFEKRQKEKPQKIGKSDWEAREHWDEYTTAANEMIHRTSTQYAPWNIVPADSKKHCRLAVLQRAIDVLQHELR